MIVRIDAVALDELRALQKQDAAMFSKCVAFLDILEQQEVQMPHMKKLVSTRNGWRYDFGRYRALFSFEDNIITLLKIFMEKDTRKDYSHWISYLMKTGKME